MDHRYQISDLAPYRKGHFFTTQGLSPVDRYSALADTGTAPLSPKRTNEELSPTNIQWCL